MGDECGDQSTSFEHDGVTLQELGGIVQNPGGDVDRVHDSSSVNLSISSV